MKAVPDVIPPRGGVLISGINPSLYSAETGHHFARPGNRFWPALHRSGWTPRLLRPAEQGLLPQYGLGITNLAARPTARADELSREELAEGGQLLADLVAEVRPGLLAVAGVTAYRTAFHKPKAAIGPQPDTLNGTPIWILPNPSGLNASWTAPRIAEAFSALREAAGSAPSRAPD